MGINSIEIYNYGCIKNFEYKFRKNKDGGNVPLVIVGKNGTGKTLLISSIVDSLVEIKRQLYPGGILEVNTDNYYRVGSLDYINCKNNTAKIKIESSYNGKLAKYIDIMSRDATNALNNNEVTEEELFDKSRFISTCYSRKIDINNIKLEDFEQEIVIYLPSDRFYKPMWYNSNNYNRISYDSDKNVGKSNVNFIKVDILDNVYKWVTDCFMEQIHFIENIPMEFTQLQSGTEEAKKIVYTSDRIKLTDIQAYIEKIIDIVKNESCRYTLPSRKNHNIVIEGKENIIKGIAQMSTGEMFIIGLALSIIKEWDINHNHFILSDINGTVIVDEIDMGLHIDYCYRVIPELMNLFPNVQFIFTTHSPMILCGVKEKYDNEVDIVNMPNGEILTNIRGFEEFKKACEVIDLETQKVIEENIRLMSEVEKLKEIDNKIIIYTEGKTDVKFLKIALKNIEGYTEIKNKIEFYDIENAVNTGDSELQKIYDYLQLGNDSNIKICIFDRDNNKYITNQNFTTGKNNVYKFNIPIPSHRNTDDRISIEHYLKDEELKTYDENGRRIFFANEFSKERGIDIATHKLQCRYILNNSNKENYHPLLIIDGSDDKKVFSIDESDDTNYALSKEDFVSNIENNIRNFDKFDFIEFSKIFDIIQEIYNETNK